MMAAITLDEFLSALNINPANIAGEDPTGGMYIRAFTVADMAIEAKNKGHPANINELNYVLSEELKIPVHKVKAFLNKYGLTCATYDTNS